MILLDPPRDYPGRFKRCSHMVSTLDGQAGHDELVAFAQAIGMRAAWIQKPLTPHEHFDVYGDRRDRAVAAGAREVDWREVARIFRSRKQAAAAAGVRTP